MEFLCKLFDAIRWIDGKLINMADQIRAWRTDFFLQNKYPWRHCNSIAESNAQVSLIEIDAMFDRSICRKPKDQPLH